MSGGSWNYVCYKVADAANRLVEDKCPYRRAFGLHLGLVSEALHDIEWVDSADKSPGDEIEAILQVIKPKEVLIASLDDAKKTSKELQKLIDEIEK